MTTQGAGVQQQREKTEGKRGRGRPKTHPPKPVNHVRGRPIVLTPCPFCGIEFRAREFRKHVTNCLWRRR